MMQRILPSTLAVAALAGGLTWTALPGCWRKADTPRVTSPVTTAPQESSSTTAKATTEPANTLTLRPAKVSIDRDRPMLADEFPESGNLLRLATAKLEATTAPARDLADVRALTDGDPSSVGAPSAAPEAPLEAVFGFGGATVTPERLVVLQARQAPPGAATARIEILVSTLSPHAGFQSVRADPLTASRRVQEFVFRPIGARWIMLRFTPPPGVTRVAVAEVAVLGREGPPLSLYAFKESPAKAIDLLARLQKISSLKLEITADEAALFEDARDGKLDRLSFAEATLLASGVTAADKRLAYLQRLKQHEAEARQQLGDSKAAFAKGDQLLRWLHAGPLAKGYVAGQTDVSGILENRTYNCVSSAALYNILGRQLGLDLRAIEVPDHAFSIQYDGKDHADVETTAAAGHNPARDRVLLEEFKKQTGFTYIPDRHRDRRREIGEVGLTAIIYYNHGVQLTQAKRYHEALLAYFRAMSLDPEFASAVKNALVTLALWSMDLSRDGKFEDSLQVLATGLDLAPQDATLRHGRKAVWTDWALAKLKAGQESEALTILDRAAQAVPDEAGHFVKMQCLVFIVPGEARSKAGDWEGAVAVGTRGLGRLEGMPREEVHRWRTSVYLRWAQDHLQRKQLDQSLTILDQARAAEPNEPRIEDAIACTIQESARSAHAQEGPAQARAVLTQLQDRYKDQRVAARGTLGYVHGTVKELCDAARFSDALSFIEQSADLLPDKDAPKKLALSVYAAQADSLVRKHQWEAALAAFQEGLKRYPDEVRLKVGMAHMIETWINDIHRREGKAKAQELLASLLKRHAATLENAASTAVFVERLAEREKEAGNFAEAIAILDRHGDLLPDKTQARQRISDLYDAWAWKLMKAKDFEGAIAVYETARQRFPEDKRLHNNFIVAVQEGSWGIYETLGEQEARRFFAVLLRRFPGESDLVKRLQYHIQQVITSLTKADQFEEAEAAIARHRHLLPEGSDAANHYHHLYDVWAAHRSKAKDWLGAVSIYQRGLERLPGDRHLRGNLIAGVQNWSWTIYTTDGDEKASAFLTEMRHRFPGDKDVEGRISYHVSRIARSLESKGAYADALVAAERHLALLNDEAEFNKVIRSIYDSWAGKSISKDPKDWQAAVDKYAEGVKQYPKNADLRHNAIVTWDRWGKTFISKNDWDEAIKTYQRGLEAYPEAKLLKDNLAYCEKKKQG